MQFNSAGEKYTDFEKRLNHRTRGEPGVFFSIPHFSPCSPCALWLNYFDLTITPGYVFSRILLTASRPSR